MWVEFLDESHFIKDFVVQDYGQIFMVRRSVLERLAQPDQLERARRQQDRIEGKVSPMHRRMPSLKVIFDAESAVLQDGHHRLVAAMLNDVEWLPTQFGRSDRIKTTKTPIADLVADLLVGGNMRSSTQVA